MRDEQSPLQWQGFRLAGWLCPGLAIVKLTLERQWSWWRVLLPFWTMVGHNALYIAVGFVWLHFVDDGEASLNEEAPDGYQLTELLCFFLFVDNLVGRRLERGQPPGGLPGSGSDLANGSSCCSSLVLPSFASFCTGPRPSVQILIPLEEVDSMRFRVSGP